MLALRIASTNVFHPRRQRCLDIYRISLIQLPPRHLPRPLLRRLEQLRWPAGAAIAGSAVLRGTYHLYQGWGGFAGNLALGAAFGYAFVRWRKTWPLVTAHFIVDTLAGVGYLLFRGHCFGSLCIPR